MAKNGSKKTVKDAIIDAALALAAAEGWNDVSFNQIILAAGVGRAEALEYFDDKTDIIVAFGRRVDARVMENIAFGEGMSPREKLFDVLMERFDILNDERDAIISILESFKGDPKQAIVSLPHLAKSMTRALDIAGIETDGFKGCGRVTGLIGVYLYVVRTWKEDDTADMAPTMAALDKALEMAEQAANSCDGGLISGVSEILGRFKPKD